MPIIEVDHVTKEYQLGQFTNLRRSVVNALARIRGQRTEKRFPFKALDDVSFSAEPGEVLGIIGHNGAGKSTLLKLLASISKPTRGSVRVHGKIAPLIEVGAGFVPDLTGRENVFLNGTILGLTRKAIARKFDEIVDFAEMAEFIDTPVKRYSSGMQVKLAFAVATSIEAEILIVDEVLAVGDIAFQRKCFDRMGDLIKREGRTVLIVSHNVRQIERVCSRALLLDKGRVVYDADPLSVCERYFAITDERTRNARAKSRARTEAIHDAGQIKILRISMMDEEGGTTDSVIAGSDVIVVVEYEALVDLEAPAFSFGLQTPDLFHIAHCESFGEISLRVVGKGLFTVTCRIVRPPLLPGLYSFRMAVGAGDPMYTIYLAEDILPFQVFSRSAERNHALRQGVIECSSDWKLEQQKFA